MILCLADDLTGLTEIACMAASRGMRCEAYFDASKAIAPWGRDAQSKTPAPSVQPEIVAVNLACRALSEAKAAAAVGAALRAFWHCDYVYLKIDSVARGPVGAMLRAARSLVHDGALPLLTANPATGRSVRGGSIFVNGVPLAESAFRDDPLHPALYSDLQSIIRGAEGIAILDGADDADIAAQADAWHGAKVAAGAAPFGCALFERWLGKTANAAPHTLLLSATSSRMLAVVGTRHPHAQAMVDAFDALGGVYGARDAENIAALPALIHTRDLIGAPAEITEQIAGAAADCARRLRCETLYIAGGETAQALLRTLAIESAEPIAQRAGMAILRARSPWNAGAPLTLCMQPGSYVTLGALELLLRRD